MTDSRKLRIAITGATGLVGRSLTSKLREDGHDVARVVRGQAREPSDIVWDPTASELPPSLFEGFDVVVHLAGENVGSGRWTEEKKQLIRDSRVKSTELLSRTLQKLEKTPALVCASAVGYYGDRGDEILDEQSGCGSTFLASVCRDWEATTEPLKASGARVVNVRIGVVIARESGAIAKALTPFKLGLGGKIGSGKQYMAWIALSDLRRLIEFAIHNDKLSGPLNGVSPNPITNGEFTRALGRALRRPTPFTVPVFAFKALYGEFANEATYSQRAVPRAAMEAGFQFEAPTIEAALHLALHEP